MADIDQNLFEGEVEAWVPLLGLSYLHYIVFKVEIEGNGLMYSVTWNDPWNMGFSVSVFYLATATKRAYHLE